MEDPSSVSIVIRSGNLGDRLPPLVAALDDQTLPYSRYEVTFLDPGSSDGTSQRLDELADRRPNVRLLRDDSGAGPDWRSALDGARGEFVLLLSPEDRLFPEGLSALLGVAAEGHDVVLAHGGSNWPVGFHPDRLADAKRLAGSRLDPANPDSAIAALAPFALIRRSVLLEQLLEDPADGQPLPFRRTRVALLGSAGSVAVCDRPVGVGSGPTGGETAPRIWADVHRSVELLPAESAARFVAAHASDSLDRLGRAALQDTAAEPMTELVRQLWQDRDPQTLPYAQRQIVAALLAGDLPAASIAATVQLELDAQSTTADWTDGVLGLTIRGTVRGVPAPDLPSDLDIRLSIRSPNGAEHDLATDATLTADEDGGVTVVARCELDVARAAAGEALAAGRWLVRARLTGTGSGHAISVALPACRVPGAVIDGTPVSVFQTDGKLQLDVGAHGHGFLPVPFKPDQASVSESARGALLTLTMPNLVVRGQATIPSALFLGSFRLPATFRTGDDGARLDCYVSGLAGVSVLEAKVGAAKRQPTGLQLRIGAAGDMAVEVAARPAVTRTSGSKAPAEPAPGTGSAEAATAGSAASPAKKAATTTANKTAKTAKTTPHAPMGRRERGGRIIRRVPRPLRPLARAAADSPVIKAAYRRITGRR